jgi:GxxExxY protein
VEIDRKIGDRNIMPISSEIELTPLSQQEFSTIAYDVMVEVFSLHKTLGRLFDEKVYQQSLAERINTAKIEVPIHVSFRDFKKTYYLDLLVAKGAVFELKTASSLNARNRSQLLNYLLLTNLQHGKLVNLRPESVEHEFVNTSLSHADRIKFTIDSELSQPSQGFSSDKRELIASMLHDWGTGLDINLYREAIHHFCGAGEPSTVLVDLNGNTIASQLVNLCDSKTALIVTTLDKISEPYRINLKRFVNSTSLNAIQWINISKNKLIFQTIH